MLGTVARQQPDAVRAETLADHLTAGVRGIRPGREPSGQTVISLTCRERYIDYGESTQEGGYGLNDEPTRQLGTTIG